MKKIKYTDKKFKEDVIKQWSGCTFETISTMTRRQWKEFKKAFYMQEGNFRNYFYLNLEPPYYQYKSVKFRMKRDGSIELKKEGGEVIQITVAGKNGYFIKDTKKIFLK